MPQIFCVSTNAQGDLGDLGDLGDFNQNLTRVHASTGATRATGTLGSWDTCQNLVKSRPSLLVAGELNADVEEKDSLAQVEEVGQPAYFWNRILGKSHRVSFGVGRHITQGVIDYVYSDLWGPSQVESLGGKRYFLSIVDDYSRRQLCDESGIARHLTVGGTPQQNGSPSIAIEKKTAMEMWSGHQRDYDLMMVFGCVAYSHVKQGKLEPRAVKCIFLWYPKGVKGYILYRLDDELPKIVTHRNVVFNESVMYKDTLKDSGAGTDKYVEELQVEVELHGLNNRTLEGDQTDQEDGDDEDARDQETDLTLNFTDY
ncbi:retrovirus-related pol polyprotein from transposon TNT 1-94 [Tanacetum coccineum]